MKLHQNNNKKTLFFSDFKDKLITIMEDDFSF